MWEKWYVYILTNPSFREDWVKIWKSSRPVDIRSKELDNTAVPLPFEIFATLQTEKYEIIEKKIHKILEKLAGKRIRKEREFFNINPEDALNYLSDYAEILDDAVILWPEYYKNKPIKNEWPIEWLSLNSWEKTYHFRRIKRVHATLVINEWKFIVKKWSRISPYITSNKSTIQKLRQKLAEYIDNNYVTKKDIRFTTPSWAWQFVYGAASNWRDDRVDETWVSLWKNMGH